MQKNDRQVPTKKEWLSDKLYSDVLYCYLQVISDWDGNKSHPRYVPKKMIKFVKLSETLGMSRQTVSKRYKWLVDLGLIIEKEDRVELTILEKDIAALVPFTTLRIMTNTLNENAISIFVYLFNRYYAEKKEFICTYSQLKGLIGISDATRSNDYIIKDILFLLEKLELIETRKENTSDAFGTKTVLYITKVNNEIKDAKDIELKF